MKIANVEDRGKRFIVILRSNDNEVFYLRDHGTEYALSEVMTHATVFEYEYERSEIDVVNLKNHNWPEFKVNIHFSNAAMEMNKVIRELLVL